MPKPDTVSKAVANAIDTAGNLGRGGHKAARSAADTAFRCRELAGELFDVQPDRVVFAFNTTHALNIAIKSLVSPGDRVVISGFEHNAVLRPLHAMRASIEIAGRSVFDPKDTLLCFEKAITKDTKAVICTHVSNVFGYILPIEQIASMCKARNVPLIIDAAQSAGILPLSMRKLEAAFVAVPGHKGLFGPQGMGLLLCGAMPEPIMEGGTGSLSKTLDMPPFIPDRIEAGTQNIHGIAGLAEGMRFVMEKGLDEIRLHEISLMQMLQDGLKNCRTMTEFFAPSDLQTGVLSVIPKAMSCEMMAQLLDCADIAVRAGLHCAPLAHESANTVKTGTLRISLSAFSTRQDIESLLRFIYEQK